MQRLSLTLFLAAATGIPLVAIHATAHLDLYGPPRLHFLVVGLTAAAATAAALALTALGVRRRDPRTVVVGAAFSVMAALLSVHGLATPGILLPKNSIVSVAGGFALPAGAAVFALSALPQVRCPEVIPMLLRLQATLLAATLGLAAIGAAAPTLVPRVPATGSAAALLLLAVGTGLLGVLVWRAGRTFLLTRQTRDLMILVGLVWLECALITAMMVEAGHLAFWIGHGLEAAGIVLIGAPVLADLRRAAQSRTLVGDLRAHELVVSAEAFLGAEVRSLLALLAEKDTSTREHTGRVALRAVQVGEELGLPASRLRTLAIGGLLHDIGKLQVPDDILKKPGELDGSEFATIQRHPVWGEELLKHLGFSPAVRRLVIDHHERLDGCGYPRGLAGVDLDLDTRILTVCDVYDALVTERVYRPAWRAERAIALLRKETGTAFDARCVAALERVLGLEVADEAPPLAA